MLMPLSLWLDSGFKQQEFHLGFGRIKMKLFPVVWNIFLSSRGMGHRWASKEYIFLIPLFPLVLGDHLPRNRVWKREIGNIFCSPPMPRTESRPSASEGCNKDRKTQWMKIIYSRPFPFISFSKQKKERKRLAWRNYFILCFLSSPSMGDVIRGRSFVFEKCTPGQARMKYYVKPRPGRIFLTQRQKAADIFL